MFDLINVDPFFLVVAVTCVIGAIGALEAREIVYGGIFLGVFLVGIAEAFILLGGSLLGMFQIVIYVGAVAVLILFTIFLVRRDPQEGEEVLPEDARGKAESIIGIISGGAITLTLLYVIHLIGSGTLLISSISETNLIELAYQVFVTNRVVVILLPIVLVTSLVGSFLLMSYDPPREAPVRRTQAPEEESKEPQTSGGVGK